MKKFFTCALILFFACKTLDVLAQDVLINPDGSLNNPTKKSFFDRFKKLKSFTPPSNTKGYWGILPDIEADFEYKKQSFSTESEKKYSPKAPGEGLLLDAPTGDEVFLDVIIKKGEESEYANDLVKIKYTLEKLRACIQNDANIQMFNANVNVLDLQTQNLEKKYQNTAHSMSNSFYAIRHVNYSAKMLGNLKYDANFYSRYMPLENSEYSANNIQTKGRALVDEIERTIFEIGNAK